MQEKENFMNMLNEWLSKGNIEGRFINIENVGRFNQAYKMAVSLFAPKKIEVYTDNNLSFAEACLHVERVEFEVGEGKDIYMDFINIIDYYNASPIDATTIAIHFNVDNIWKE
jgi:hypothetical protein